MADPLAALALVAAALLYGRGVRRLWAGAGTGRVVARWEAAAAAAGLVCAGIALASPLDAAAERTLTAHMVQHVLLLAVAPPLLAVGALAPAVVAGLPQHWRPTARRAWRRAVRAQAGLRWVGWATLAFAVQTAAMWVWHLPALYGAALAHPLVHALEHGMFLATATAFWWTIAGGKRSRLGWSALALFVAGFPGTALGAALLLAPRPWYPTYAQQMTGPAAMADQQLAGVVMWSFAGLAYVVGAAALLGAWLRRCDAADLAASSASSAPAGTAAAMGASA